MNTSLLFRSLSLALAWVVPAFASASDDLVTLDSIIAAARTAPVRIKLGMDRKQVCDALGAPDVVIERNLWGYVNLTLRERPPGEGYDALVIHMIDGRVHLLKLTKRTAVLALVARLNQAKTGRQGADVTPRQ